MYLDVLLIGQLQKPYGPHPESLHPPVNNPAYTGGAAQNILSSDPMLPALCFQAEEMLARSSSAATVVHVLRLEATQRRAVVCCQRL